MAKEARKAGATISRLLRRNLSKVQLAGFVLSNFIGLAIVISGIQFYSDIKSIWEGEDSFINQDYLIINKKVTASHTIGTEGVEFTEEEVAELERQPWVRSVGKFSNADYEVRAYMEQAGRGMSTNMFLETIPDSFIDVAASDWHYAPGDSIVPIIISKDYLTLYNFGFASSAGLPRISEGMLSSVPMRLRLSGRDVGSGELNLKAKIVGYSGRLNTILVPETFMQWSNGRLGSSSDNAPRRLIIDVSSPGDVAINRYLDDHNLEQTGDSSASQAAYFLKLVAGVVIGIGGLITLLSFFILLLSVSLLMQKNRSKLHLLIMLGYKLRAVGIPYEKITIVVSAVSYILAVIAMLLFRNIYIDGVEGLAGGNKVGITVSLLCGATLVVLTLIINIISIRRKVRSSFYS